MCSNCWNWPKSMIRDIEGLSNTRNIRYKKPVIRNAKWTSPNSVSCKEQTSPFSLETSQFFES